MTTVTLALLLSMISCQPDRALSPQDNSPLTLTVHPAERYQTIHGFGASDAWSIQFVGKQWPVDKRNAIADLLFSTETDADGNPEGIGLSIWRFNIGAGSARQGAESGIGDPWRRSESFLTADSTYDWTRQRGQQWFLRAAAERGVEQFIGFANSPPVLLTRNGYAYGDGSDRANIAPEHYDEFADYLVAVAAYLEGEGVPFDYISPVNEPQWDWSRGNGQEGSPWQNSEIAALMAELDRAIRESDRQARIEIPETARIDFIYGGDLPGRSRQAGFFFGEESGVTGLATLERNVAAHSYFTTWPVEEMIRQREQVWRALQATDPQLEYVMSEYCILANNEEISGGGRDLGIDPALYVARVIHFDLTAAHASSWQWWLAVSPYDFKDGLVYIDRDTQDGSYYDSKLLWGLGNYSRFIRPGSVRVGLARSDEGAPETYARNGVMASAYVDADGSSERLVLVAVNNSYDERDIRVAVEGNTDPALTFTPYITSGEDDLARHPAVGAGETVRLPARSIVTLTGSL